MNNQVSPMFIVITTLVGIALTVCAVYLAWTGPRRKLPKKELSFGIISNVILLSAAKSVADDVSMTYKRQSVKRLAAVTVSIMNTGQVPIIVSDFEKTIKVTFYKVSKIFSIVTLRCSPLHLDPKLSTVGTELFIDPLLLNPGDFITLRAILENTGKVSAQLEARIAGIGNNPALHAGSHPGYDVSGLILYGGLLLFSTMVFSYILYVAIHGHVVLYWLVALFAFLALLNAAGFIATIRDTINLKRSRWMGNGTQELSSIEDGIR